LEKPLQELFGKSHSGIIWKSPVRKNLEKPIQE
jgi:hypothetical protein